MMQPETMSLSEVSDEQLMRRVTEENVSAYRMLYDRYAPVVKGLVFKILRDEAVAEEIVQETFWRVWDNAASFDCDRGSYANWMFGIARNLAIDTLRRGQRITWQSLPVSDVEQAEYSTQLQAHHDVFESTWTSMRHSQVRLAMTELPAEQQDVINWIYFQGKTRRQIAEEHGIPFGTVNTRAKLALDKLKRSLQAQGYED